MTDENPLCRNLALKKSLGKWHCTEESMYRENILHVLKV
jgi:hypothetical protein